jgi:hypothetical protein
VHIEIHEIMRGDAWWIYMNQKQRLGKIMFALDIAIFGFPGKF